MMAHSTWHVYGLVFVYLFMCFECENVIKDPNRRSWPEAKPAISMEYKVHIDARKDECFYQYAQPGADLYVSFQVIRGGDGMAGFIVRNPNGEIVHPYKWEKHSEYSDKKSTGGYYDVCIDNTSSTYSSKIVNIFISVVKYDDWDKSIKELEALHLNVENFKHIVSILERNIHDMRYFQSHSRGRESRDMALLLDNESYVQNWSVTQIIVIILTCIFQVYFVRKLFNIKTGSTQNRI